jgi:hypothetical protein
MSPWRVGAQLSASGFRSASTPVFKKIWQSMKVSHPTTTGPSSEQRNVRDVPRAEIQII